MKRKYTWTIMHGDADHFDKEEFTTENSNEIAFWDYLFTIKTEDANRDNGLEVTDAQKTILVDLFKKLKVFEKTKYLELIFDEQIRDYLMNMKYMVRDCRWDCWAETSKQEIKEK